MRLNTGCFLNGCKCFDPNDEDGVEIKNDREWQDLTDAEAEQIVDDYWHDVDMFIEAIEAKLKDKNT